MHPLLQRQLAKYLGARNGSRSDWEALTPEALDDFVRAVDAAYTQADSDRAMLERSLELTSDELMERNTTLAASLGSESQRAQEGEQRLRLVMNTLAQGVVIFDLDARIVDLNEEAAALFGVPRDVALGKRATHGDIGAVFIDDQGQPLRLRDLGGAQAFTEGRPVRNQLLGIRRADGTEVYVRTSSAPMLLEGGTSPQYLIVSYTDITAARLVERMKSDLITAASHQLRAPLTGIVGFAALLERRTDIPREAVEWASVIAAEASRLSRIGNDLLDAARLGTEQATSKIEPVRIAEVAHSVASSLEGLKARHRLTLSGDEYLELLVDRGRLHQVLSSVVEHLTACAPGGGDIAMTWAREDESLRIDVGLDAAATELLAEQRRSEGAGPYSDDAAGLELALVKRSLLEMGGHVTAEDDPSARITYSISLPLTPPTRGVAVG